MAAFLFTAALFVLFAGGKGWAFHEGGVGACEACHTMHNSITAGTSPGFKPNQSSTNNGVTGWTGSGSGRYAAVNPAGSVGNAMTKYLLRGADPSSTCLNCHEETGNVAGGFYISTADSYVRQVGNAPLELTPGGDFGWLKKTYTWGSNPVYNDPGYLHGHNIVAADFLYTATTGYAPGGGANPYPSSSLTCISCHDPHGTYRRKPDGSITNSPSGGPIIASGSYNTSPAPKTGQSVGVYRLLGGAGYLPPYLSATPAYAFSYGPPAAISPSIQPEPSSLNHPARTIGAEYSGRILPRCYQMPTCPRTDSSSRAGS